MAPALMAGNTVVCKPSEMTRCKYIFKKRTEPCLKIERLAQRTIGDKHDSFILLSYSAPTLIPAQCDSLDVVLDNGGSGNSLGQGFNIHVTWK